jgi:hypothetical protein
MYENIFSKIIAKNFPNLGKKMTVQVQEGFRTPNRQDQKRTSLQYSTVKKLVHRTRI